jgi:hypothetical protein
VFVEFRARRLSLPRRLAQLATSYLAQCTVVVCGMPREAGVMCSTNIQGGIISIVTVLRAGRSGVRILEEEKDFSLLNKVKPGFRATQPPIQRVQGSFAGREGR